MKKITSVKAYPNFPKIEKEILNWWKKNKVLQKYLEKNKKSNKTFSFLDGPITANNPMGVHHAWGRTYKDLWQRYKNMQGFSQRFRNGFDCQGLWVEVEVEKELGLKNKKDIEKFGIARFVNKCKKRVKKFSQIQTKQSIRLGYFMDWDNSYFTMSEENNYMIWFFLKKCWQNGWIYKGFDSIPWCPRCGTAISQHEMLTEDYQEVIHQSVYFKLPLSDKGWSNVFLLVWTTTPWTLPGNVAVAVDPEKDYLIVNKGKEKFIVLKKLANKIFPSLQTLEKKVIYGKDLIGKIYFSPFDNLPRVKKVLRNYQHRVVASDNRILAIEEKEGTGLIHLAPSAGREDYALSQKEKLPLIHIIDEEANYLDGLGELSFKNAKKDPDLIFTFLQKKTEFNFLWKIVPYKHRYPVCWRCKEELVWRAVEEWYIKMDSPVKGEKQKLTLREKMIRIAQKINWIPKFGLKRELDWLKNMDDWLISKKRYWGLALPIWECSCGHFEVIGSKEELKKRAVKGWNQFTGHSPHRPWLDKIEIQCQKCKKLCKRITDVGNPWLDAGIVNFSTLTDKKTGKLFYFYNKKEFERWFPADFITESFPGQFKNWFYALIVMATVLENRIPYKTVLGFGTLLAEDGRPMHKSWGNAIDFNEGADKIGVDVMRWMYCSHNPAKNLLFGYKNAEKIKRKFHFPLWNVFKFFITYSNLNKWKKKIYNSAKLSLIDKWILTKLDLLCLEVSNSLDKYDAFKAASSIESFVNDLSTWYLRRSRERMSPFNENKEDRNLSLAVLHQVLLILCRLLAPFIPFLTEYIYQNLMDGLTSNDNFSIHLTSWPKVRDSDIKKDDLKLLDAMNYVRYLCEEGHNLRKRLKIKVRQPLLKLIIKDKKENIAVLKKRDELKKLIQDELNVKKIEIEENNKLEMKFDSRLTIDLINEGKAREIIRQIQEERKKRGCSLKQKILVYLPSWPNDYTQEIKKKTLTSKLVKSKIFKIKF